MDKISIIITASEAEYLQMWICIACERLKDTEDRAEMTMAIVLLELLPKMQRLSLKDSKKELKTKVQASHFFALLWLFKEVPMPNREFLVMLNQFHDRIERAHIAQKMRLLA